MLTAGMRIGYGGLVRTSHIYARDDGIDDAQLLPIERTWKAFSTSADDTEIIFVPLLVQLVPIGLAILVSNVLSFAPPPLFPLPVPSMPIVVLVALTLVVLGASDFDE